MITKLGIYGCPSFYGGADTELRDQIYVWHKMGIELHVVPTSEVSNPVTKDFVSGIATLHKPNLFEAFRDMPVISFCNKEYLLNIHIIKQIASHTIWVNCMTWPFIKEKRAHKKGLIDLHIYQTKHAYEKIKPHMLRQNSNFNYAFIIPYFDVTSLPFRNERDPNKFVYGRISRDDNGKYMPSTIPIYEAISAPIEKEAHILGIMKAFKVIGRPNEKWIHTYQPSGMTQRRFYEKCDCIVQTSEMYENWPRVGLESLASGSVLIVYKNDGWSGQVIHGETGYLCKTPRDFVFYASHLAHNPDLRKEMAVKARDHLDEIAGLEASAKSWESAFNKLG